MDRTFSRIKTQSLSRLDLSKKGSVDEDIEHVVSLLNSCEQFFTTSSCSGRIILIDGAAGSSDAHKQNCVWLFVSHQKCTCDDLMSGLSRACGDAVLKFEPFVLHVQCRRLEDAQLLHSVAVNSGFRNSGLTVGKTGKIVSAVRSTHGLEVPLSRHGKLLVDEDYIQFLTQIANQKMEENLRRVQRLFQNLQSAVSAERQHIPDSPGTQEHQDSQHTHKKGRRGEQGTNKQNQLNVNKRRHQHETDGCHDYGDSSLPELNDCLDLFT
ncbi:tRNA wybutosine-synthesizing protein 3 homolog isoform X2 [Xiphophorus hellerii]|uniref:tRNA wybutosine-synthesizing protein 3 homolog isoform X2 n=1 Tax=Xiphophorus hellerii TaxID=8084 RepID=UPI0013B35902|nr:tRNA wybutosine-synthesizing protein 3 homolog isoform X2 [Xiphophorus hellerii]